MSVRARDRIHGICLFICGAIAVGLVLNAWRTGQVAYEALIPCLISAIASTTYFLGRSRNPRR